MAAKAVIECDGNGCDTKAEFPLQHFNMGDLPTIMWGFDQENDFYYCPACDAKLEANGEK